MSVDYARVFAALCDGNVEFILVGAPRPTFMVLRV